MCISGFEINWVWNELGIIPQKLLNVTMPETRTMLLLMVVSAMNGCWLVEQPTSSQLLSHPRVREVWRMLPRASSLNCWNRFLHKTFHYTWSSYASCTVMWAQMAAMLKGVEIWSIQYPYPRNLVIRNHDTCFNIVDPFPFGTTHLLSKGLGLSV